VPDPAAGPAGPAGPLGPEPPAGVALLASPVRRAVVDELAALDEATRRVGLTAAELGSRLGLHTTTIRFHVDQLVAGGMLEAHFVRSGGVGRPSKKYLLHERAFAESSAGQENPDPYRVLAGLLASAMSAGESEQLTPEEAGVRWARKRAASARAGAPGASSSGADRSAGSKVDGVIELLAEWGYTPQTEPAEDGTAVDITLRQCPFLDLAHTHPDVVCGVHRGLLRGALTAVGEPDGRVSLQPFVGPDTCRARLYLTDDDSRSAV
jgi:predicted ArsR family transcriptional regulator